MRRARARPTPRGHGQRGRWQLDEVFVHHLVCSDRDAPPVRIRLRTRVELALDAAGVAVERAAGKVVEQLVEDDEIEPAGASCDELVRLRMDEVERELRRPRARQRPHERRAGRAGRHLIEAGLAVCLESGLERPPRILDREVLDLAHHRLVVHAELGEQLEQRRREHAVVRADLEDLQIPSARRIRIGRNETRNRQGMQVRLGLGLEQDLAADRVVEARVDLGLGEPCGHGVKLAECVERFEKSALALDRHFVLQVEQVAIARYENGARPWSCAKSYAVVPRWTDAGRHRGLRRDAASRSRK